MLEFHGDMTGEYKKLGERPLRSSPNFQTSFWLGRIFHQHRHAFSKRIVGKFEKTGSLHIIVKKNTQNLTSKTESTVCPFSILLERYL